MLTWLISSCDFNNLEIKPNAYSINSIASRITSIHLGSIFGKHCPREKAIITAVIALPLLTCGAYRLFSSRPLSNNLQEISLVNNSLEEYKAKFESLKSNKTLNMTTLRDILLNLDKKHYDFSYCYDVTTDGLTHTICCEKTDERSTDVYLVFKSPDGVSNNQSFTLSLKKAAGLNLAFSNTEISKKMH